MMGACAVVPGATILHVDLDAFFAAVEQRDRPELRGRPVIVGGGGPDDRGVVSAASYEARRFGVRSAMPLRTAAALCPDGVFVPVDGRKYGEVSRAGHGHPAALRRRRWSRSPSTRRSWMWPGTEALHGTPGARSPRAIKAAIRDELGLTASVGVASTRLVAKIASDLRKPDGLVVVPEGTEAAFLAPLPIWRLWGVGEQTRRALADYGVRTIGDLAGLPDGRAAAPVRGSTAWCSPSGRAASIRRRSATTRPPAVGQPRAHVRRGHARPGDRSSGRCWRSPKVSPAGCATAMSRPRRWA